MNRNDGGFCDYLAGLETKTFSSPKKEIDRTYRAVMKKAGLNRKAPKTKRIGRVCLIAAAAVACTAVTAAAAGFNVGGLFRGYFERGTQAAAGAPESAASLTRSQIMVLDKSGRPVNRSVTDNGTTITVKAAVADKNSAYILLDVTAPEGTILDRDDYGFEEMSIDLHDADEKGKNWNSVLCDQKDENTRDNKKTYVLRINSSGLDLQGREIGLSLTNLSTLREDGLTYDYDYAAKGSWKFDFKLGGGTDPKKLTVKRTAHYIGTNLTKNATLECTVETVSLSALSATVDFSGGNLLDSHNYPEIPGYMTIQYRDGTKITTTHNGPGHGDKQNYTTSYAFDAPIDVDSISSVTIGDLTVPVS